MTNLLINEIFGPTIQGEGPNLGLPSIFIRTQFCDVGCAWCDTKYTWAKDKTKEMSDDDLLKAIHALPGTVQHLVITGGEPFAQPEPIERITKRLLTLGYGIEFETSGTRAPARSMPSPFEHKVHYNVSPKPPSAEAKVKTDADAIAWFKENKATFKFVIQGQLDLTWVKAFIEEHGIPENRVFLMPEGKTEAEVAEHLRFLWEAAPRQLPLARVTPRMHIQAWGPRRGI